MIWRNPCRIKGAEQETSAERPTLTVPRSARSPTRPASARVLILLAMFTSRPVAPGLFRGGWRRDAYLHQPGGQAAASQRLPAPCGGLPTLRNPVLTGIYFHDLRHTGNTLSKLARRELERGGKRPANGKRSARNTKPQAGVVEIIGRSPK